MRSSSRQRFSVLDFWGVFVISFPAGYPSPHGQTKQNIQTLSPRGEVSLLYYVLWRKAGFLGVKFMRKQTVS
jgi:hypothetical protein